VPTALTVVHTMGLHADVISRSSLHQREQSARICSSLGRIGEMALGNIDTALPTHALRVITTADSNDLLLADGAQTRRLDGSTRSYALGNARKGECSSATS
ncbi:MAG: hypothetical protein ACKOIA_10165, partial [Acidimicrobiia bacterium]